MNLLFAITITAFILCLGLTPLCRNLALRFGLVDQPDEHRKLHGGPIPRVGGVAIVLSYTAALAVPFIVNPSGGKLYIQHHQLLWSLLPATAVVFLTGLLDDLIGLKPWQKLIGQIVAAILAVSTGAHLRTLDSSFFAHHPALATPWLVLPASVIWLIVCTNAVNLIDGLDGLAAGVGLFATITTLLAALMTGNAGLVLATLPLAGALLAFLCFNFSPASIFLGDCGSLTIGFALGCFALIWSQRGGTMLGLAAPLMALALPLIDVCLAICRRFLRRVPIFKGDRGHIHHMVLARGFKPRTTTLILYGVCAVAASLALMQSFSPQHMRFVFIGVFLLLIWSGVRYLDYIELDAARRVISGKRVLRYVRDEIYFREVERSLLKAESPQGRWAIVSRVCMDLQFDTVEMLLEGVHFQSDHEKTLDHKVWHVTLPIGDDGYLKCSRSSDKLPARFAMSGLERLQEDLNHLLAQPPIHIPLKLRRKSGLVLTREDRSDAA